MNYLPTIHVWRPSAGRGLRGYLMCRVPVALEPGTRARPDGVEFLRLSMDILEERVATDEGSEDLVGLLTRARADRAEELFG